MATILVTGANRGLGLEMVKQYSQSAENTIIACCRNPDHADELNGILSSNIEVMALAVDDLDSIEALGQSLGDRALDILINNAGIFGKSQPATTGFQDQRFGHSDFEPDWIMPYRVNVIGPMKMVETLVDNIAASEHKKVVIVTSMVASIENAMGQMFGYSASKAAANMTARNLAVALKKRNIIVNPMHPGYAKTDMGGEQAYVEPADAVAGVLKQIAAMSLEQSGEFLSFDGGRFPW